MFASTPSSKADLELKILLQYHLFLEASPSTKVEQQGTAEPQIQPNEVELPFLSLAPGTHDLQGCYLYSNVPFIFFLIFIFTIFSLLFLLYFTNASYR